MKINEFRKVQAEFLINLEVERNLSLHTKSSYGGDFNQFLAFWEKINSKEEATIQEALDRFFVLLFHKKHASSSIARKVSSFKSLEKYLEKKNIKLGLNLTRPRLEKKLPVYLSIDEMFKLLDTDTYDLPTKFPLRDKTILELLYATGIRCAELVNIRLQDINIHNKTIRIIGKGNKERFALFNEATKARIENYIKVERNYIFAHNEYLFINADNKQLSSRTIQRIVKMFRKFLNVEKKITPHKIRHTFATHLLNQGVDIRILQELLGHKSLSSTEKYTHVTTTHLTELCKKLHPINTMKKINESTRNNTQDDK